MSAISRSRQMRRIVDLVRLGVATLIGGLIVLSATKIQSMIEVAEVEETEPVYEFQAPELSEEWKWKREPVRYEHMYRQGAEPRRSEWIRNSGR